MAADGKPDADREPVANGKPDADREPVVSARGDTDAAGWSAGQAGRSPDGPAQPLPDGGPQRGPWHRFRAASGWRRLITLAGGAALGAAITLLIVQDSQGATACSPAPVAHKPTYHCVYSQKAALWYAGNSTARTKQVVVDMFGPDVAELQCLLQRDGITPGGIDGNFGPLTEFAVIQAQKRFHLDIDSRVGPHTWAALRR